MFQDIYTLNKKELVLAILEKQSVSEEHYYASGILDDIHPENGFGFLRTVDYKKGETDIYISASQIRRFELKKGDEVYGKVRKPREGERYAGILQLIRLMMSMQKLQKVEYIFKL